MRTARLLLVLLAIFSLAPAFAVGQGFTKLTFQVGHDIAVSGFKFSLEEPDNPAHPTLWQGPLTIHQGATQCRVDSSLVHEAYLSVSGKLLVVVSSSGSNTLIDFFRPETCAHAWPGLKAFTKGVEIKDTRLTLLPACECPGPEKACSCTAGAVYKLAEDRPPHRLAVASDALNLTQLGQAFTGTRTISHPPVSARP